MRGGLDEGWGSRGTLVLGAQLVARGNQEWAQATTLELPQITT